MGDFLAGGGFLLGFGAFMVLVVLAAWWWDRRRNR